MRKLIAIIGLAFVVAVAVVPIAAGSDYRGRYQLRLSESTALLAPSVPAR
jgi:hypothetical protein